MLFSSAERGYINHTEQKFNIVIWFVLSCAFSVESLALQAI